MPWSLKPVQYYRYEAAAKEINNEGMHDIEFLPEIPKHSDQFFFDKLEEWIERRNPRHQVVWTSDPTDRYAVLLDELESRNKFELVAEVDDYFEDLPKGNMARQHWYWQNKHNYLELLGRADRVICSTPFLADKYEGTVCPNFIDPSLWDWPARESKREDQCVVFLGAGSGRAGDIIRLRPALEALLKLDHVKLVFMGPSFPEWCLHERPGKVVHVNWAPFEPNDGVHYRRLLSWIAPDVMLSPLEHNDFNIAKSNLKWLESAAVGACFVGERWGEYKRTVQDGVTGVLCDGAKQWRDRLVDICNDADRRHKIIHQGRQEMLDNWTWPAVRNAWIKGVTGHGELDVSDELHLTANG